MGKSTINGPFSMAMSVGFEDWKSNNRKQSVQHLTFAQLFWGSTIGYPAAKLTPSRIKETLQHCSML